MTPEMEPGPPASSDAHVDVPAPGSAAAQTSAQPATPTPEERLAETLPDDVEVGSDGTGMGELP